VLKQSCSYSIIICILRRGVVFRIKFQRNQIFAITIAFIFIFYGIAQSIFKFNVNKNIIDAISFILAIIAGGLILSGRKKK